jgi:hypothetical protein
MTNWQGDIRTPRFSAQRSASRFPIRATTLREIHLQEVGLRSNSLMKPFVALLRGEPRVLAGGKLSWRFDSYPFVPGCHTFLILHGIAETFGLDAELA